MPALKLCGRRVNVASDDVGVAAWTCAAGHALLVAVSGAVLLGARRYADVCDTAALTAYAVIELFSSVLALALDVAIIVVGRRGTMWQEDRRKLMPALLQSQLVLAVLQIASNAFGATQTSVTQDIRTATGRGWVYKTLQITLVAGWLLPSMVLGIAFTVLVLLPRTSSVDVWKLRLRPFLSCLGLDGMLGDFQAEGTNLSTKPFINDLAELLHEAFHHLDMTPSDVLTSLKLAKCRQQMHRLECVEQALDDADASRSRAASTALLSDTSAQALNATPVQGRGASASSPCANDPARNARVLTPMGITADILSERQPAIDSRSLLQQLSGDPVRVSAEDLQDAARYARYAMAAYGTYMYGFRRRKTPVLGYLAAVCAPFGLCCRSTGPCFCLRPNAREKLTAFHSCHALALQSLHGLPSRMPSEAGSVPVDSASVTGANTVRSAALASDVDSSTLPMRDAVRPSARGLPWPLADRHHVSWGRSIKQALKVKHQMDREAFLRMAKLKDRHLIYDSQKNKAAGHVPFYVSLDKERKTIVISIRGSMSIADVLTDGLCRPGRIGKWLRALPQLRHLRGCSMLQSLDNADSGASAFTNAHSSSDWRLNSTFDAREVSAASSPSPSVHATAAVAHASGIPRPVTSAVQATHSRSLPRCALCGSLLGTGSTCDLGRCCTRIDSYDSEALGLSGASSGRQRLHGVQLRDLCEGFGHQGIMAAARVVLKELHQTVKVTDLIRYGVAHSNISRAGTPSGPDGASSTFQNVLSTGSCAVGLDQPNQSARVPEGAADSTDLGVSKSASRGMHSLAAPVRSQQVHASPSAASLAKATLSDSVHAGVPVSASYNSLSMAQSGGHNHDETQWLPMFPDASTEVTDAESTTLHNKLPCAAAVTGVCAHDRAAQRGNGAAIEIPSTPASSSALPSPFVDSVHGPSPFGDGPFRDAAKDSTSEADSPPASPHCHWGSGRRNRVRRPRAGSVHFAPFDRGPGPGVAQAAAPREHSFSSVKMRRKRNGSAILKLPPRALSKNLVPEMRPGEQWSVVVTGHSLGAGVAAFVALALQLTFPDTAITGWLVGCPAGLMSAKAADAMDGLCKQVALGKDLITRLTMGTFHRLRTEMVLASCRFRGSKANAYRVHRKTLRRDKVAQLRALRSMFGAPNAEAQRHLDQYRQSVDLSHATNRDWSIMSQFRSPGRVAFLRPLAKRSNESWVNQEYDAVWVHSQDLLDEGILISAHMMVHHLPDVYTQVLKRLVQPSR